MKITRSAQDISPAVAGANRFKGAPELVVQSESRLLTVEDVAHYLQFTPETVRSMVRRGELPAIKVGRRWRFRKEKIEAWIQTRGE